MRNDLSAARRLRVVQDACRQFITLWALEGMARRRPHGSPSPADVERSLADPHNHDWSLLYANSVLDD